MKKPRIPRPASPRPARPCYAAILAAALLWAVPSSAQVTVDAPATTYLGSTSTAPFTVEGSSVVFNTPVEFSSAAVFNGSVTLGGIDVADQFAKVAEDTSTLKIELDASTATLTTAKTTRTESADCQATTPERTGDLCFDTVLVKQFSSTGTALGDWEELGAGGGDSTPIGTLTEWPAGTPPSGWLLADGSSVSTITYTALFNIIGYDYGGSGANFNLPDLTGRFVVGQDTGDTDFDVLGETGGESDVTLTISEMPSHSHTESTITGPTAVSFGGGTSGFTGFSSPQTSSTGGGSAHENLPPYFVTTFIIKAFNVVGESSEISLWTKFNGVGPEIIYTTSDTIVDHLQLSDADGDLGTFLDGFTNGSNRNAVRFITKAGRVRSGLMVEPNYSVADQDGLSGQRVEFWLSASHNFFMFDTSGTVASRTSVRPGGGPSGEDEIRYTFYSERGSKGNCARWRPNHNFGDNPQIVLDGCKQSIEVQAGTGTLTLVSLSGAVELRSDLSSATVKGEDILVESNNDIRYNQGAGKIFWYGSGGTVLLKEQDNAGFLNIYSTATVTGQLISAGNLLYAQGQARFDDAVTLVGSSLTVDLSANIGTDLRTTGNTTVDGTLIFSSMSWNNVSYTIQSTAPAQGEVLTGTPSGALAWTAISGGVGDAVLANAQEFTDVNTFSGGVIASSNIALSGTAQILAADGSTTRSSYGFADCHDCGISLIGSNLHIQHEGGSFIELAGTGIMFNSNSLTEILTTQAQAGGTTARYTYTGDLNTGGYSPGDDEVAWRTGTVTEALHVTSTGTSVKGDLVVTGTVDGVDIAAHAADAEAHHAEIVFGTQLSTASAVVESSTTGSAYQQHLRLTTPVVPAGLYYVSWMSTLRSSTNADRTEYRMQLDDTTDLDEKRYEPDHENNEWPGNGSQVVSLGAGTHTFDLDFRMEEAGTAFMNNAYITFWRVQ